MLKAKAHTCPTDCASSTLLFRASSLRVSVSAVHFEYGPLFRAGNKLFRQPVDVRHGDIFLQEPTDSFSHSENEHDDRGGDCKNSKVAFDNHSKQLLWDDTGRFQQRQHLRSRKSLLQREADSDLCSFEDMFNVDSDDEDEDSDNALAAYNNTFWDKFEHVPCGDVLTESCNTCNDKVDFRLQSASSQPSSKCFDRINFARVYDLMALRVPLAECETLSFKLKGHLLNWPQINNIASVVGDDMDWDTKNLLTNGKEGGLHDVEDSLLRAVYGTPRRSGNSSKKFNSRSFQVLAQISQLSRKASREMRNESAQCTMKRSPRKFYMVELGYQDQKISSETTIHGFSTKKWTGPSRLLLLDARYAGKSTSELPMAVQVLLNEHASHGKGGPRIEIIACKLTLFYEYWSMEEILENLLPGGETMPLAIRIMGHIALLRLGEHYSSVKHIIGKVVLDKHRPKVKTVVNKLESMEGQCHPILEVLAGNHSLVTTVMESGLSFLVNLATVYWNTDFALERQRLIKIFSTTDIICDVFAGAGSLALASAKKVRRVFANDANSEALKYLAINVAENKLHAKVELYNLDGGVFLRKLLAFKRPVLMTQVVFSLPTIGETFLDAFEGAFNRQTWPATQPLPTVHVYGYSNAKDPEKDFLNRIVYRLGHSLKAFEMHRVKQVESAMWLLCASFQLPEALAFDDSEL